MLAQHETVTAHLMADIGSILLERAAGMAACLAAAAQQEEGLHEHALAHALDMLEAHLNATLSIFVRWCDTQDGTLAQEEGGV